MKQVIIFTVLVLAFVGCSPKKASKRTASMRTAISGTVGSYTPVANSCGQNQSNIGTIYDQGSSFNGSFESQVKGLLSATVDPAEVGQISGAPNDSTGVRFQGQFKINSNGSVDLAQTKIIIKVYDSYVVQSAMDGSNQYQAIPIEFAQAAAGQFNMQTGSGYVVFRDQYGEIRFDGTLSGDYLSGQVSFVNTTNVTGGAAASGVLGQFYVARCGIIK